MQRNLRRTLITLLFAAVTVSPMPRPLEPRMTPWITSK